MAEGENFEEDLFADLYDDNDVKPAPAATSAPAASAPPAVASDSKDSDVNGHPDIALGDAPSSAAVNNSYQEDDDDDDDEVDFNLGGGSGSGGGGMVTTSTSHAVYNDDASTPPSHGGMSKPSAKEDGKMFIGGLNWETTDESLGNYFSQFGEVTECTVMRDNATGRSRGFGFLTFKDAKTVNIVMVKEHFLDGKIIDPKRAIPRDEQEKTSKIFVGGVSQETTDQEFREYFAQFGRVVDATLMMDKDTGRPRGFGFVTFESEAGVDACINVPLEIHGKPIEVKKAQPRGNLREEEDAQRRMKFNRGNDQNNQGMGGGMGGQQNTNGMTPQVMAQYFQRMQQYFAMMQSQMAMRGMPMNPAQMQMQQMQMQQMMGRGGPGGQNMMNPQMMQQMQQMQQQQQQMMQQAQQGDMTGGGAAGGAEGAYNDFNAGGGGGGGGGSGGRGGFQHRGGRRGGYGGGYGGGHGGNYGGGGGGGNNNYGGQQSYEGMYDDVPQGGGPQNAPPANAPTGPKNAGKPGANYRGGGRGGNRGFHPYAR